MPTLEAAPGNQVRAVIRSASQRTLLVNIVEQTAFALAIFFGGAILMLILGTQILDWRWLALLGLLGLTVSIVRIQRRTVTRYRVAQVLDRRLRLHDSLSTAWFVLSEGDVSDKLAARFQIRQADEVAASIVPASAFPFEGRRTWAVTGALAAVLLTLFAVRYLAQGSLHFEQSLIPPRFATAVEQLARSLSPKDNSAEHELAHGNRLRPQSGENERQSEAARSEQSKAAGQTGNPENGDSATHIQAGDAMKAADTRQSAELGDKVSTQSPETGSASTERTAEGAAGQTASHGNDKQGGGNQESPSAFQKMKDAVSSLLAKMKSGANSEGGQKSGESADSRRSKEQNGSGAERANSAQTAQNDSRANAPTSAATGQSQTRETSQSSQGRNRDGSGENNGSGAHSGVGRQDGEKSVKEAEQLQAMGKLAEIIGKRSASVTGEITVETSSGKQQLKTDYSRQLGQHSDLGGEINRDEIPLADQQYVREYMERVRKEVKGNR